METSGFRPDHHHHHHESHVPQQSRRDKLRVQQALNSAPISHHFESLSNTLDHQFTLHQDHARNSNGFLYEQPGLVSPEILGLHQHRNGLAYQDLGGSTAATDGAHGFMINWSRGINANAATQSFDNWPAETSFGHGDANINYRNNDILGEQVVTVASAGNELALLPFSFANLDNHHQNWNSFECNTAKKRDGDYLRTTNVNDTNLQGLSLSLSSNNVARVSAEQTSSGSDEDLPKPCAVPKPSIISKSTCGKSLQDIVGVSSSVYRSTAGPLGPFTGYATILKNSRFLMPAQQLLDDLCGSNNERKSTTTSTNCDVNSERFSGGAGPSISAFGQPSQLLVNSKGNHGINNDNNNSFGSSSTFYGSNEINSSEHGGIGSNVSFESGSSRPEQVQQKKAKLLYMQEEVSRKYKQYRHQMQMVVSSFESVAGLSSATPYIALALKAVARHFRCLKSAIAEQLGHARRALGEEDLAGPTRPKFTEQSLQKHSKPGGTHVACPEPQQHHIWRPQRGLPERSVAVLRAWLFEHFLHPYPTDSDKHMLATQTGLTRNQVSNWFINARVRVWKPMVEEIHTLETKGLSSTDIQGDNKLNDNGNAPASKHGLSAAFLGSKQLEFSGSGNYNSEGDNHRFDQHEQSQEKRSRLECQSMAQTGNMSGAVVQGFVPYLIGTGSRSGAEPSNDRY